MWSKIIYVFSLIIFVKLSFAQDEKLKPKPTPFQDWDYFVFTQRWPPTACMEWLRKNKSGIHCNMPKQNTWVVHGLWPTKFGEEGPYFCDSAVHFDWDQLQPIKESLNANWTDIEQPSKTSLWQHEWDKHGTCSVILPQLDSVINYFRKGLDLRDMYNIYDILSQNKIIPSSDDTYTIQDVYVTIQKALNKNPAVECVGYEKNSYINEVRICLNKTFDLIDCNIHDKLGDVLSNCNLKKPLIYGDGYPNVLELLDDDDDDYGNESNGYYDDKEISYLNYLKETVDNLKFGEYLLNLYKWLKFSIWFTL